MDSFEILAGFKGFGYEETRRNFEVVGHNQRARAST